MNWFSLKKHLPNVAKLLSFRGRVAYWRGLGVISESVAADLELGMAPNDTTVIETKSPELLISSTTRSWEAAETSSPFIWRNNKNQKYLNYKLNTCIGAHLIIPWNDEFIKMSNNYG